MFRPESLDLAHRLLAACERAGWRLATAESCTGGLVIACLTEIPGSSTVVDRGFVVYDNRAKEEMLGVPAELLAAHGAVSEPVARAMAEGALERGPVDLAISLTGVAGPSGGTATKPVGLVHIACATKAVTRHERHVFQGDRSAVREASLDAALILALGCVPQSPS